MKKPAIQLFYATNIATHMKAKNIPTTVEYHTVTRAKLIYK